MVLNDDDTVNFAVSVRKWTHIKPWKQSIM